MSSRLTRVSRRGLGQRGSTTLEFALVALAFLMLLLGSMEVGRYYFTSEAVRTVTAEAGRRTMLAYRSTSPGTCPTSTDIKTYVTSTVARSPFIGASNLTLNVTCGTTTEGGKSLRVAVSYPFSTPVPWLPVSTTITDESFMVVEPRT